MYRQAVHDDITTASSDVTPGKGRRLLKSVPDVDLLWDAPDSLHFSNTVKWLRFFPDPRKRKSA